MLHPLYRGIAGASPGAAHFYMVTANGMVPYAALHIRIFVAADIHTAVLIPPYRRW
jgi:hypothetical protein